MTTCDPISAQFTSGKLAYGPAAFQVDLATMTIRSRRSGWTGRHQLGELDHVSRPVGPILAPCHFTSRAESFADRGDNRMRLLHVRHVPGAVDDVHRGGTADTGCVRSRHDLVFAAPDRNGGSAECGQFRRHVDGGLVSLDKVAYERSECLIHAVEVLVLEQILDELAVDQSRIGEQRKQVRLQFPPRLRFGEAGADSRR